MPDTVDQPPIGAPIEPVRLDVVADLDHAIGPTTDLDAFVNARWRASHPVPADRSCWDCFTILGERALQTCAAIAIDAARAGAARSHAERVVGDFWRSGMDDTAEGIDVLRDEFARIDALDSPTAVARYLHDRHARGWGLLYRLEIVPDADDPAFHTACITQGGLGLPDRDDYLDSDDRGKARRAAYRAHVAAMLAHGGLPAATAPVLADAVLAVETRLAEASLSRRTLARDVSLRHRRIGLDEADRQYPVLRWHTLFEALGATPPPSFSLPMPAFHAAVDAMLRTLPIEHWHAYLRFHTLDETAPYLHDVGAEQHHHFHGRFLRGQDAPMPRWKRVLQAIDRHVGEAMGPLFVARSLPADAARKLDPLVERLRAALQARLERADWMSASARAHAVRKLAAMKVDLGGPEPSRDWSTLPTSPHDWYANLLAARAQGQRWAVARLGQPVDAQAWSMLPQTVNARYEPQRNAIVFPAAILQAPFFDPHADDALNFGGIGAVIAHEMTHAFDDQGSRFDAEGRFRDGWTAADRLRFDARARRLLARIDGIHVGTVPGADDAPAADPASACVDGRLTLGENIADFGGLAIACDAFQQARSAASGDEPMLDGYSPMQRFFLNWAAIWRQNLGPDERRQRLRTDPHAPAPLRANAAASDLAAFAAAFGCVPGDGMWRDPDDRVGLW